MVNDVRTAAAAESEPRAIATGFLNLSFGLYPFALRSVLCPTVVGLSEKFLRLCLIYGGGTASFIFRGNVTVGL